MGTHVHIVLEKLRHRTYIRGHHSTSSERERKGVIIVCIYQMRISSFEEYCMALTLLSLFLCNRPMTFQRARYPLFIACLDLDLSALYLSHFRRKRITLSSMKSVAEGSAAYLRGSNNGR